MIRTIKTILFVGLIAVMILPFSSMDFADAMKYRMINNAHHHSTYPSTETTKEATQIAHPNKAMSFNPVSFDVISSFEHSYTNEHPDRSHSNRVHLFLALS